MEEREDLGTPQEIFDSIYQDIPADDSFWELTIGDPGPDNLFAGEVYTRGAMTLHALRMTVGDEAFFTILRRWATRNAGENVTTREFVALAERISGQELSALFDAWLFTPTKPDAPVLSTGVAERLVAPATPASGRGCRRESCAGSACGRAASRGVVRVTSPAATGPASRLL